MPMSRLFQLARAEAATPPKIGSSVLRLSCCSIGRDRVCHTENGRQHLKNNPAVKNPEEQSYQGSEKRKQSLDRRLLECQDDPDYAGDEANEQVNPVEKFQHPRSCPDTKGKIQQTFQHSPGFSHLPLLQPKDSEEEYRGRKCRFQTSRSSGHESDTVVVSIVTETNFRANKVIQDMNSACPGFFASRRVDRAC